MTQKILSIIIPMYNSIQYIQKCLDSVILDSNDMEKLEVIVINDGSTDRCDKIVEKYIRKYPGSVKLINQKNGGHGAAVNTGIQNCTGRYFRILDADDWFNNPALKRFIRSLQKMKNADLVVGGFQTYDIVTHRINNIDVPKNRAVTYYSMAELMQQWKALRHVFTLHGITYNTAFYKKNEVSLPTKVFYDDAMYITVAASQAKRICVLDELVYVYRIGDVNQSVSNRNRVARIGQMRKVIRAIGQTENIQRSASGQKYWYSKTGSVLADYFVTTLLRFEDKKEGRTQAKRFMKEIKNQYPEVAGRVRNRYCFLYGMSLLHLGERQYEKVLEIRSRI